jgi:hypothetical protein
MPSSVRPFRRRLLAAAAPGGPGETCGGTAFEEARGARLVSATGLREAEEAVRRPTFSLFLNGIDTRLKILLRNYLRDHCHLESNGIRE